MPIHCKPKGPYSLRLRPSTLRSREEGNEADGAFVGSDILPVSSSTSVQRYVGCDVFPIVSTIYNCEATHSDAWEDCLSKEKTTPTEQICKQVEGLQELPQNHGKAKASVNS